MTMLFFKIKDVLKFASAFVASRILLINPHNRNVWIITERRNECKDNGYYLFRYIRSKYPELRAYYAIDRDSPQRKRIEEYGNILDNNSWKHYIYALMASRLIGAFLPCGIPDSICFYKFSHCINGKKVFLQHGITKEIIPSLDYDHSKVDMFVCGAKPECDFIRKNFHYPSKNVVYTGFCRFDGLHDFQTERIVLVMPTWRQWIPSATWHGSEMGRPDEYEYFRMYKELVNDVTIGESLKKNNTKMIFFLHHEVQPYMDYFDKSDNNVVFATEREYDVQHLLKKCALLITDYSSVAFDVAYMKKPIIYYQFDEEKYYSKHYSRGYFDYNTMGFGAKCKTLCDLRYEINDVLKHNFEMKKQYCERAATFFELSDRDNCKRVFEAITRLD